MLWIILASAVGGLFVGLGVGYLLAVGRTRAAERAHALTIEAIDEAVAKLSEAAIALGLPPARFVDEPRADLIQSATRLLDHASQQSMALTDTLEMDALATARPKSR